MTYDYELIQADRNIEAIRSIFPRTGPPECVACGEPCRFVYTRNGNGTARRPWANIQTLRQAADPRILWLCSRCVAAAARGR